MNELDGRNHGVRDAAVILPFAIGRCSCRRSYWFCDAEPVGGIPLIVLYVYGVWALAVISAFLIARKLELRERVGVAEDPSGVG